MVEPRRVPIWVLALVLVAAVAAALFYRENPVPDRAEAYAADVATASAGTFLTLRSLNAVLSSVQEIEVGGSLVVSGTAQPFKFLEPVDDTIERISGAVFWIMLVAGVLSIAMGPVSAVGAGMVALATLIWLIDRAAGPKNPLVGLTRSLVWYGSFLGLGLPLAFLVSAVLADRLSNATWAEHEARIQLICGEICEDDPTAAAKRQTWSTGLQDLLDDAERYRELASRIYNQANELIASYIAILSVFVFQIFLLPALIAGAFFLVARHGARGRG